MTMGEIADTMRSALSELAQADARLYRGLAEELGDGATAVEEPRALIQPEGGAPATEAQLLALKNDALQELCAQRGIKVPNRPRKNLMVGLLLADPNGPPPLSLLPPPKTKTPSGGKGTGGTGKAGTAELQALEQRLVRLEQLVLLIAQQVGVAPEAIERLLPPAAPPT
jgi:hypothetical protein